MPNRENIQKWVDALRSGEYEQGKGYLEVDNKFCCLGVACDVAVKSGVRMNRALEDGKVSYDGMEGVLPDAVMDWLGIESDNPFLARPEGGGYERCAAGLNDDLNWTFEQIADAVEKKYLTEETANV